jgi:uncharacterized protein YndB with AHSA1/START domain
MSPLNGGSIRITRRFEAAVERVWQAFTEPDDMAAWMWAGMGANPRATADVRPGGRYEVAIDHTEEGWDGDTAAKRGVYAVVEAPHRLIFTVHWDAPMGYNQQGSCVPSEVAVVRLAADGDGTVMDFEHHGIPDDGVAVPIHEVGIAAEFDHLGRLVEG